MTMDAGALITPRRNFLVRALGFTAAGATLTVPVVTLASPEDRLMHHMKGAEQAFQDLFPTAHVDLRGNCLNGGHAYYADLFARQPEDADRYMASMMVLARIGKS